MHFAKRSRQPDAAELDVRDLQRVYQEWSRVRHQADKMVEHMTLPGGDPHDPLAMCPACSCSKPGKIEGARRRGCATQALGIVSGQWRLMRQLKLS